MFNNDCHCSYPIHVVANTEIHVKSTSTWYDLDSGCVLVYNGAKRVRQVRKKTRIHKLGSLPMQFYPINGTEEPMRLLRGHLMVTCCWSMLGGSFWKFSSDMFFCFVWSLSSH